MKKSLLVALGALALTACATVPTGPSVMALPGTGKDFNAFRASDAQCRYYAAQSIGMVTSDPGVRDAVVGTAVGAAAGAAIGGSQGAGIGAGAGLLAGSAVGSGSSQRYGYAAQRRYDEAYIQCMYASGHKVPVPESMAKSMNLKPVASSPAPSPAAPAPAAEPPAPAAPPPPPAPPSTAKSKTRVKAALPAPVPSAPPSASASTPSDIPPPPANVTPPSEPPPDYVPPGAASR